MKSYESRTAYYRTRYATKKAAAGGYKLDLARALYAGLIARGVDTGDALDAVLDAVNSGLIKIK